MSTPKRQTLVTCARCKTSVPRVYQFGLCRDCLIKQTQNLRPLIDHYRDADNFRATPKGAA